MISEQRMGSRRGFCSVALRAVSVIVLTAGLLWVDGGARLAYAGPTKVGNGDDGTDLEGAEPISSGPIVETRAKAVARLRQLNVSAISGLGLLIPEVERTELLMAKKDVRAQFPTDQGMESSPTGDVLYARTFAEPHAATRFFPATLQLNDEQLIALHIHEGLHRSLAPSVRENEAVVSHLTMAIASPDATYDRVRRVAELYKLDPSNAGPALAAEPGSAKIGTMAGTGKISTTTSAVTNVVELPAHLSYTYKSFDVPTDATTFPVQGLHSVESLLYPFGTEGRALGLGVELTYMQMQDNSFLGPLSLSARVRLATVRDFEMGGWGVVSLNTVSNDQVRESPLGRDVTTVGLSARKETTRYYLENLLSYSLDGEAQQKIGPQEYTFRYGGITTASIRAGGKWRRFALGGLAELHLAEGYDVNSSHGGAFATGTGRYHLLMAGPEISWTHDLLQLTVFGRWVVDAPKEVNLDYLGDITGRGSGSGSVGASMTIRL